LFSSRRPRWLAIDALLNDVQQMIGEKNTWAAGHVRCSESQMTLTPLILYQVVW
jgi:hypothetical protein